MKNNSTFEFGTIAGLILGVLSIFGSFLLEGGTLGALILIPAMLIVFGGTIATAMISSPAKIFFKIPSFIKLALIPPKFNVVETIETIVNYAIIARKDGILALEKEVNNVSHPFLKKMLRLAIDGTDPETIREIADVEINYITERHMANATVFQKMGGYAPTMGIIGTVMGLISTLANAGGDPNELIHHIASAFIATLWGVFSANVIWLPIADRLKAIHAEEKILLEIIVEGVLAIQAGEVPTIIKTKLYSMFPISEQKIED
jgi:chemotaxis protein MotA